MVTFFSSLVGKPKKSVKFAPLVDVVLESSRDDGRRYCVERCKEVLVDDDEDLDDDGHMTNAFDLIILPYIQCASELMDSVRAKPARGKKKSKRTPFKHSSNLAVQLQKQTKTTVTKSRRGKVKRGLFRPKAIPGRETPEQMKRRLAKKKDTNLFERFAELEREQLAALEAQETDSSAGGSVYLIPANLDASEDNTDVDDLGLVANLSSSSINELQKGETREGVPTTDLHRMVNRDLSHSLKALQRLELESNNECLSSTQKKSTGGKKMEKLPRPGPTISHTGLMTNIHSE